MNTTWLQLPDRHFIFMSICQNRCLVGTYGRCVMSSWHPKDKKYLVEYCVSNKNTFAPSCFASKYRWMGHPSGSIMRSRTMQAETQCGNAALLPPTLGISRWYSFSLQKQTWGLRVQKNQLVCDALRYGGLHTN